jgi:NCS1 family nucleobase:cation symporter-1
MLEEYRIKEYIVSVQDTLMEYSAFEKVPQTERTWTWRDQFVFWFSACSLPAAWYYGALMAGWQGISGAFVLIIGVNALSLIPWAYLGEMAATTGGSSMSIIRPAFGIRGSIVPSIFYLIFGLGWAVVNVFLGAIALSFVFKLWLGWPSYIDPHNLTYMISYIAIVCATQGYFAVSGNQMIRKMQWWATIFFVILGSYQTYMVIHKWGWHTLSMWVPKTQLTASVGPFIYPITFALLVDLLVSYNWTWEFIGDFSRFAKNRKAGAWGPFWGAFLAQIWWFLVGACAVVYLALTTGQYSPLLADPSSTSVAIGLGWLAALVILFATITSNAGNIYASAIGISNILGNRQKAIGNSFDMKKLLWISAIVVFPLSLLPLLNMSFVGSFIFFLDFVGALVIPLWTIAVVDYFWIHNRRYTDDIFKTDGGIYWYKNGWNWPGVVALVSGTFLYWIFAYAVPQVRQSVTATIPTILIVSGMYLVWMRSTMPKSLK